MLTGFESLGRDGGFEDEQVTMRAAQSTGDKG
jgi:hypothetical protein